MGRRWAVACVVVWVTGCGDGGNQKVRSVTDAIAVDPGSYDFGDVALGREERGEVVVRNDGVRLDPRHGAHARFRGRWTASRAAGR